MPSRLTCPPAIIGHWGHGQQSNRRSADRWAPGARWIARSRDERPERLRSPEESFVAALEARRIRPIRECPRQLDRLVVRLFQADKEHRPIRLLEDRLPDFDRVVRPNGKEEARSEE